MRRSGIGRAAVYGALLGLATAAVAEAVRPRGGTTVLVDWDQVRRAAPGPSRRALWCRLGVARPRPPPRWPDRAARRRPRLCQYPNASCLHIRERPGAPVARSVDVGPAPVALEHDLASFAAEDDLEVAPPDRRRVTPAHGAGCCLHLERRRQGFDLDL